MTSFLKRCWYVGAWSTDLKAGDILPVTIADQSIVLFRASDGKAAALRNRCPHRFAPLSHGRLEADGIRCMYHGLKFSPSGKCIEIPGQDKIPDQAAVATYLVVEKDDWIWIWLGEPDRADPSLIPQGVALDHPDWAISHGYLDYDASYMLINDNLLDFSHLSFVHATSFGSGSGWADTRPKVKVLDRSVRIQRWLENQPRSNSRPDIAATMVDHYSLYDYSVPGVLFSTAFSFPTGTAQRMEMEPPPSNDEAYYGTITAQAVTPISAHKCRYFFSRGIPRDQATPERMEQVMKVTRQAFEEDRSIIEAQQKIIIESGSDQMFVTTADKSLVLFRRLMARLEREETAVEAPAEAEPQAV